MAEIYGLYSGRDGAVRYVGQTGGDWWDRFIEHQRDAESWWWKQPQLCKWFHDEWRDGYPVECARLESCGYDVRQQRETDWIQKFPNLLNERKRYGYVGKPPKIPEIVDYMRRYLFNVGGFRGIRWDRHWDCYQVLIYTGSGVDWLLGDEMMPGWGGNMYFPDRTAALIARDNDRKWRRSMTWIPDVELELEL